MTKRLVDVDDEALSRAKLVLGTSTLKDTVNAALDEVARSAWRRSVTKAELRRAAVGCRDLSDPEIIAAAWD